MGPPGTSSLGSGPLTAAGKEEGTPGESAGAESQGSGRNSVRVGSRRVGSSPSVEMERGAHGAAGSTHSQSGSTVREWAELWVYSQVRVPEVLMQGQQGHQELKGAVHAVHTRTLSAAGQSAGSTLGRDVVVSSVGATLGAGAQCAAFTLGPKL